MFVKSLLSNRGIAVAGLFWTGFCYFLLFPKPVEDTINKPLFKNLRKFNRLRGKIVRMMLTHNSVFDVQFSFPTITLKQKTPHSVTVELLVCFRLLSDGDQMLSNQLCCIGTSRAYLPRCFRWSSRSRVLIYISGLIRTPWNCSLQREG